MTTADVLWDWLGPGFTDRDPDGVLRVLVDAYAAPLQEVEDVVRGSAGRPGWAAALDPDTAPAVVLPWLAQFAGVRLDERGNAAGHRAQIKDRPAARSGTPATIRAAARPHLSFGEVILTERYLASAWRVRVVYDAAQVDGQTYDEVAVGSATYNDLNARFGRYSDWNGSEDDLQAAVLRAVPADIVTTFTKNPQEHPLGTTTNLGLPYPEGTDPTDVPADIQALAEGVDTTVLAKSGGTVTASAAGSVPLTVKGAVSQTANLLEAQDSAAVIRARVTAAGVIQSKAAVIAGDTTDALGGFLTVNAIGVPAAKGIIVRGAVSQSANLAEFQDSAGAVLSQVSAGGGVLAVSGTFYNNTAGAQALIVRGAASQTANLAEFQNSAGTVVASVTSAGQVRAQSGAVVLGDGVLQDALYVQPGSAAQRGLRVYSFAGQTANLAEFHNSAGTVLAGTDATGRPILTVTSTGSGGVLGYVQVILNGVARAIPYYAT